MFPTRVYLKKGDIQFYYCYIYFTVSQLNYSILIILLYSNVA